MSNNVINLRPRIGVIVPIDISTLENALKLVDWYIENAPKIREGKIYCWKDFECLDFGKLPHKKRLEIALKKALGETK